MIGVKKQYWTICIVAVLSMGQLFSAEIKAEITPLQQCILEKIEVASDATTMGALRALCQSKIAPESEIVSSTEGSIISKKHKKKSRLSFSPHKANYVFPISYNATPNAEPYDRGLSVENINNFEMVFQLSSKMRIIDDLFGDNGDLYGAYTGRFWWQAYNNALSSPFRETNHEPEFFLDFETDYHWGEWSLTNIVYGMVHQSNGKSLPLSRSWNRLYMDLKFRDKQAWINFKPWFHVPEDAKESAEDPLGDDNPDIDKYMGYFELSAGYDFGKNHISTMLRNNLRSDSRGAFQLNWTFPILDSTDVRGYVQYFSGYGESMIDYNASTNRLSIGFIMWEPDFQ